jgi:hypothetical protein
MIKKIALVFSYLLHPLIMPTFGILVIFFSNTYLSTIPFEAKKMLVILVVIGTLLLPALMIPLFFIRGMVSDIAIRERRERIIPLFITFIFYTISFFLFIRIPVYRFIHAFLLGSALAVLAALLINFKWKISTHMIGIGGLSSLILVLSLYLNIDMLSLILVSFMACGIVGSSRAFLKAHSFAQIYAGFAVGFLVMLVCLLFF